jgi:Protein involved in formate dehydrogenase formation
MQTDMLAPVTRSARTVERSAPAAVHEQRRRRSLELSERYPFASDIFALYEALLDVWSAAATFDPASRSLSAPVLATYAAEQIMPQVIDATLVHGPQVLAAAVSERWAKANFIDIAARWLVGDEITDIDRYLARASLQPLLEVLDAVDSLDPIFAGDGCRRPQDDLHCPSCGGLPQASYFDVSAEALVAGTRRLVCSRCSSTWALARLTCASCGEQDSKRLQIFHEKEMFAHIRVDACENCKRYILSIDLKKDGRAVPLVDELAALPLDLYAQEHGYKKIVPNLMGN